MIEEMEAGERKVFYQFIIEEVVIIDKKVQEVKLKFDEQIQQDIIRQSLAGEESDRDIFVKKICLKIA